MTGNDADKDEAFTYRYFILGYTTPVRLEYDSMKRVTGAQVPDAGKPDGFRWSMAHLTRIEQSEEVEEVDEQTFNEAVKTFLANRAAREKKTPIIEPGL